MYTQMHTIGSKQACEHTLSCLIISSTAKCHLPELSLSSESKKMTVLAANSSVTQQIRKAFKKHDRMQSLQVSGKLQGNVKKLSLKNLDAIVETIDGVKLQANGNVELHPKSYILTKKDAGLSLHQCLPWLARGQAVGEYCRQTHRGHRHQHPLL